MLTYTEGSPFRVLALLALAGTIWVSLSHILFSVVLGLPPWGVLAMGFLLLLPLVLLLFRRVDRERRQVARVAEDVRARLDLLLRHLPVALWTVDRDLRFTSVQGRGLARLGVDEEDLLGSTAQELFGQSDDARPLQAYQEALNENRSTSFEVRWNERTWKVRLEPIWEENQVSALLGVAMDVTDEEAARRRVEEQRAHLRQLFEEAPEGIVLVNDRDVILDVNSEFQRMFGYTRAEALERPVNDLIVPEGRFAEAETLTRRVVGGEKVEAEAVRRRKDGTLLDVSILATPVDLGDERRVYGIYRDVTQQKATELQLLHSQRLEAVGQLAGGVAHDFNNILTVILGQVHSLLHEVQAEQLRQDLLQIDAAASRARNLTRQLLTFSRRDVVALEEVDLDEFIDETRDFLQRTIGEQVELVTELAGDLPAIRADPNQLQQVMMNLLINARDAMPEGGRVAVRTRALRRAGGEAGWTNDDPAAPETILLEVEDSGHGMNDEEAARIFEPFFTTKPQGTGLGMSTVYGIVERIGGHIEVETAEGEGTIFRIRLPAMTPETDHQTEVDFRGRTEAGTTARSAERGIILLADDDTPVMEIARTILEDRGYRVVCADSGSSALGLALNMDQAPNLLLTNLVLPGMTGEALAERIQARWPGLPTLFMTGYTEGQWTREFAMRPERTHEILQKPFDPNTLVRRVREVLSRG